MTIAPAKDFVSTCALASQRGVTVRTIEKAAERLGLEPACRINFVYHWDGEQCEKITAAITQGTGRKQ